LQSSAFWLPQKANGWIPHACVLYQLLRLRMANPSFGRIAPESPAPEGMDKTGRSRFSSVQDVASARKMPLKVGKSGVIIRTVSRIIFGLVLPPVSVRVVAVSP
jgi:hypothetical protein